MLLTTFKSCIINNTDYSTQGTRTFSYHVNKLNIAPATDTQELAFISFSFLTSSMCIWLAPQKSVPMQVNIVRHLPQLSLKCNTEVSTRIRANCRRLRPPQVSRRRTFFPEVATRLRPSFLLSMKRLFPTAHFPHSSIPQPVLHSHTHKCSMGNFTAEMC